MIDESSEKQALIQLIQGQLERPGDHYIPNAAQENFIRLTGGVRGYINNDNTWVEARNADNFIDVFVAANGVGKTDIIALIAGELIDVIDNPYFRYQDGQFKGQKYPFYRHVFAGGKGRIISSPTNLVDNIIPRLIDLFPEGSYKREKRGKEYYSYFEGPKGKWFDLMSFEQELDKFRSATRGWVIIDEPDFEYEKFIETTARLRRGGKIMFTFCPLDEAAWIHDTVVGSTSWDVGTVYAKIWANAKSKDPRGILEDKNIDNMIAGWDEQEYAARALGEFTHLRGIVYPQFNHRVHVIDPSEVPDGGTIYCMQDPHDERPPFFGWFKVCDDGRVYMIREWPEVEVRKSGASRREVWYADIRHDDRTIDQYAEIVKQVEEEIGEAYLRKMDARFGNKKYPNSGKRVFEEWNDRGVPFELAGVDPTLERGHAKVKSMLRYDFDGKKIILPRFYITRNCRNTIRSFERYCRLKRLTPTGRPMFDEKNKDPMDVVRMIADADECKYVDPAFLESYHRVMVQENAGTWAEGL